MKLLAVFEEKFNQWFVHAKPECKCQVRDCWEDIRWLYLTRHRVIEKDYSADAGTVRPMHWSDLLYGPKELWRLIQHPIEYIKEDARKEQLIQEIIFRTCNEHHQENSFYTQKCLRELGWYLEENSPKAKLSLFPTWIIIVITMYALLLLWALTSGSGITIPFLDPDMPLLW